MSLTKYTADMAIIQKLDDEPNDSGGLSPAQLKSKFDEGGEAVKAFLNNTLLPEVDTALGTKVDKTTSVNGHELSGNVEVTKGDVGLGNADNTSDMSKPVSAAQAAALALKANKENVLEKDNTTPYTPTQGNHPATKKYVDETTAAVVMGTLPDKSVTQQKLSFIPAEIDPVTNKVKKNQMPTDMFLPVAGGTLDGPLTLPADPTAALHAVPKQYADAVGRNAMAIRKTLPVAAGQTIAAGDVVDVFNGEVIKYKKVQVGTLPAGAVIQLDEEGTLVDYIVVNQGKPSGLYDASCNGTWVLRKDVCDSLALNANNQNDYANSTLTTYLNTTFLARFGSAVQAAIKTVKIPYRPGTSGTTVNNGANGLSCKVFLLSGYEVGLTDSVQPFIPPDGNTLLYFEVGQSTTANSKRVGYRNGTAVYWRTRSPNTNNSETTWAVSDLGELGGGGGSSASAAIGYRPTVILDSTYLVNDPTQPTSQAIALQPGTAGQSIDVILSGVAELPGITAGMEIASPGVYGYCPIDGWVNVFPSWRPEMVVTGSYKGTGLYGVSTPNVIPLPFKPSVIIIYGGDGNVSVFPWITGANTIQGVNTAGSYAMRFSAVTTETPTEFSWYSSGNAAQQLNLLNAVYAYVIIR